MGTYFGSFLTDQDFISALYIVAFTLFIVGMKQLTKPSTARRGNMIAAVGMAFAVAGALLWAVGRFAAKRP